MKLINKYALFGNHIKHTLSPLIYNFFAKEMQIIINFQKFNINKEFFHKSVINFFKNGGELANITSPFKKIAVKICDTLTHRAYISKSINLIIKKNNLLLGDNTDGLGLLMDLRRVNFLRNRILIIGAGGVVQEILPYFLKLKKEITITNRNIKKAEDLFNLYKRNNQNFNIKKFDAIEYDKYELIINATSAEVKQETLNLPKIIISKNTYCYDLNYNIYHNTKFITWCQNQGSKKLSDGIGMLVYQAALSFFIKNSKFPKIRKIIEILKNKNYKSI